MTARYASEIEPFPIAVTRARFPNMEHLGDVKTVDGSKIEPCELVTFGSPCVGLSVAGKGGGLADPRSGLFHEAIRVMREMLEASSGEFPHYFLFENVPNLLGIHKGADWKIVMDECAKLGFICDPCILDSQEFFIPQRRKRIFIAGINRRYYDPADFAAVPNARDKRMQKAVDAWTALGDGTANGMSFKRETFHGISSRPHEIRRRHLSDILERNAAKKYYLTKKACLGILRRVDAKLKEIPWLLRSALEHQAGLFGAWDISSALNVPPISFQPGATARLPDGKYWSDIAPTIVSQGGDNMISVAMKTPAYPIDAVALSISNHPQDSRIGINPHGLADCLTNRCGSGGNSVPMCAEPIGAVAFGICSAHSNSMNSSNPKSGVYVADSAKTLDTSTQGASGNQGGLVICEPPKLPTYCYEGNAGRKSHGGNGVNEEIAFTLRTTEKHLVAYSMTTGGYTQVNKEQAPTLMARDFKSAPIVNVEPPLPDFPAFGIDRAAANQGKNALYKPQIDVEYTHALTAQGPGMVSAPPDYIVRKLTETECLVLMDMPRDWCENIAVPKPTEDDYKFWDGVFNTLGKPKTRASIATFLSKPFSMSACYRLAGNGVVKAVAKFVMQGIVDHANRKADT